MHLRAFRQSMLTAILIALATNAAITVTAFAGALSVSPILVEFTPGHGARAMEISNPSDKPMNVQLRLFAWTGGGVDETYAPSQDIGFSPPMFQLAPGQKQVVRLATRVSPQQETAYRLFVDQIESERVEGLTMPVRMALPVFVTPEAKGAAAVDWRIVHDEKGALLVARNQGSRRMRLTNLALEADGKAHTLAAGLAGYVLAGQERAWRLEGPATGARLTVIALTDQGPIRADVRRD